ncbi:MAG: orotidine 5'-phosphate decarboxylase [Aigarchaeota archaeon]|nr:orotidine 5'-phosphate decarboxylase [Aigarchaeota archaeon]MCX8192663.1 orotidine 5'-phosphate decarboxylase [Nitrososphaeria archaeon]MDW7985623.1 orotidine 5'-phosphate decarboxylase / HUMPS family protein [Nitrososphaerota archaeon]
MRLSQQKNSKLILAVDYLNEIERISQLLEELEDLVVATKLGIATSLLVGCDGLAKLIEKFKENMYFISDFKLADIPEIMIRNLEIISEIGFDGSIIHLFPMGYEEVASWAIERRHDLFGVAMMSHPDSILFDRDFNEFLNYSKKLKLKGVVIGATKSDKIREARAKLGSGHLIISPGIGVQGAAAGSALKCGADFEIVGRAIILSNNPRKLAEEIVAEQRRWLYDK